jgi:type VI secretion system protein ImpA
MSIDTAFVESLLVPVSGEDPAGPSLRHDRRYDAIRELRPPPGGASAIASDRKAVDWKKVAELTSQLLRDTKDLELAAFLTEALVRRDAMPGLANGFAVVQGLLDRFWDTVHPEATEDDDIEEVRIGSVEWLNTKLLLSIDDVVIASDGTTYGSYTQSRRIPTEKDAERSEDKREERQDALSQGRKSPEEVDAAIAKAPVGFFGALHAGAKDASEALTALERTAGERFKYAGISLTKLRAAVDGVHKLAETQFVAKGGSLAPVVAPGDQNGDGDGSGSAGMRGGVPPAGWATGEDELTARIAAVAKSLREDDRGNPAPYLMLRGLRWGELRKNGDAIEPGLLEAPRTDERARIKRLALDGQWPELIEQAEALMATPRGRAWLDAQRYVIAACDAMGGQLEPVGTAIRAELRSLLGALPSLPDLTMMDDTPVANGETRSWLAREGLLPQRTVSAPSHNGDDSAHTDGSAALEGALVEEDDGGALAGADRKNVARRRRTDFFASARAEVAAKRPNRAIELLVEQLDQERSPRGRFIRQTQIAHVMVEAGLDAVARPILERLVETIDERKLDEWESGSLVAHPMVLLCRLMDRDSDSSSSDRNALYLRICRLDPLQAMALYTAPAAATD